MSNYKSKKSNYVNKSEKLDLLYLIPIIIAVAIVPLIVYMKVEVLQGIRKDYWVGGDNSPDFFSYYKSMALIAAALIAILFMIIKKFNNNLLIKKTYMYIPAVIFAFFVFLSTSFSQYKDVATTGFVERYEGAYVLFAYIVLLFVSINFINTELHIRYVINALMISSAIVGLIGLAQYIGFDLYRTTFGKSLILPIKYQSISNTINFTFEKFRIYTTLYNPNYVGSYIALTFPIGFALFMRERKLIKKVFFGLLSCLLFLCIPGSESTAGLIGLVGGVVVFVVVMRKILLKNIKAISIVCVAGVLLFVGVNSLTGTSIMKRLNIGKLTTADSSQVKATNEAYINNIIPNGNTLKIDTDKGSIVVVYDNKQIKFLGSNNEALSINRDNSTGVVTFSNQKYSLFRFTINNNHMIGAAIGTKSFEFTISGSNFKVAGVRESLIDIAHPQSIGFEHKETAFSERGYIWSRSTPMLKNTLFIGHGPDTYPMFFPQNDVVGKLNTFRTPNIIVDKPHNMYLQMAINTGVISLLAFLALVLMYFAVSVKLYIKREINTYSEYIGVAILTAVCGFCIAGIANDSTVSVSPVFWVLLGIGIACNMINKKNDRKEKTK